MVAMLRKGRCQCLFVLGTTQISYFGGERVLFGTNRREREGVSGTVLVTKQMGYFGGWTVPFGTNPRERKGANALVLSTKRMRSFGGEPYHLAPIAKGEKVPIPLS